MAATENRRYERHEAGLKFMFYNFTADATTIDIVKPFTQILSVFPTYHGAATAFVTDSQTNPIVIGGVANLAVVDVMVVGV